MTAATWYMDGLADGLADEVALLGMLVSVVMHELTLGRVAKDRRYQHKDRHLLCLQTLFRSSFFNISLESIFFINLLQQPMLQGRLLQQQWWRRLGQWSSIPTLMNFGKQRMEKKAFVAINIVMGIKDMPTTGHLTQSRMMHTLWTTCLDEDFKSYANTCTLL